LTATDARSDDRIVGNAADLVEGRYRLVRAIAAGAMGTVHEAEDVRTADRVAIKMLKPELHGDGSIRRRFRREASVLQALAHPGIVRILDVSHDTSERSYTVMELLRGETLEARIARGPMPIAELRPLALALAETLATVHAHGIVHGDVKPANVFLPSASGAFPIKLVDFGLSKIEGLERLTRTGELTGTPAYMAPELLTGQADVDGRVDLYALGVVLHEALSGALPFATRKHPGALMMDIVGGRATPLESVRSDLASSAIAVVKRAMAPKPSNRPKDAGALWVELDRDLR
jgi:serine/threonine-protein kinase